ncbi:hypothetical protein QUB13_25690 [Microcoleus sp. B4-D4]
MAPTVIIVGFISFPVAAWVIVRCAALFPDIVSGCIGIIKSSQQSTVNSQQSTVNSQQSTINSQQSTVRRGGGWCVRALLTVNSHLTVQPQLI